MDWNAYGFVAASEYRTTIVVSLYEKPKTPKQICDESDYYLSHVSNALNDMSDRDVVRCLTPERRKGRVYDLTELGEEVAKQIDPEV